MGDEFAVDRRLQYVLSFLAALGAGLGTYSTYQTGQLQVDPTARADPWTGTDARVSHKLLEETLRREFIHLDQFQERQLNRILELCEQTQNELSQLRKEVREVSSRRR